jgi:hypothetical protein
MKKLYFVDVFGDSESHFAEYYTEEEVAIIKKFFDDMSNHGVASYDIPYIEFTKRSDNMECKHKHKLNCANFCKVECYYCTFQIKEECKKKHPEYFQ